MGSTMPKSPVSNAWGARGAILGPGVDPGCRPAAAAARPPAAAAGRGDATSAASGRVACRSGCAPACSCHLRVWRTDRVVTWVVWSCERHEPACHVGAWLTSAVSPLSREGSRGGLEKLPTDHE